MTTAARTPKYMYKTAPGNSGELSIEYGTDLGALTRLEVSTIDWLQLTPDSVWSGKNSCWSCECLTRAQMTYKNHAGQSAPPPGRLG